LISGNGGAPIITMGTAAASPVIPDLPAGHVAFGLVYLDAGQTTLAAPDLDDDYRVVVPAAAIYTQRLSGDVGSASTTAGNSGLSIPLLANEIWRFDFELFVIGVAGGIKFGFTGPAGYNFRANLDGRGANKDAPLFQYMNAAGLSSAFNTFAGNGPMRISGIVQCSATAGGFAMQFATGVSGTVTVQGHSNVMAHRMT
jgi:hypothetical protein